MLSLASVLVFQVLLTTFVSSYKCKLPVVSEIRTSKFVVGRPASIRVEIYSKSKHEIRWLKQRKAPHRHYAAYETGRETKIKTIKGYKKSRTEVYFPSVTKDIIGGAHSLLIVAQSCPSVLQWLTINHTGPNVIAVSNPKLLVPPPISVTVPRYGKSIDVNMSALVYRDSDMTNRGSISTGWTLVYETDKNQVFNPHFFLESRPKNLRASKVEMSMHNNAIYVENAFGIDSVNSGDIGIYTTAIHRDSSYGYTLKVQGMTEVRLLTNQHDISGLTVHTCSRRHIKDGIVSVESGNEDCIICMAAGFPRPSTTILRRDMKTGLFEIQDQVDNMKIGASLRFVMVPVRGIKSYIGEYRCQAGEKTLDFLVVLS